MEPREVSDSIVSPLVVLIAVLIAIILVVVWFLWRRARARERALGIKPEGLSQSNVVAIFGSVLSAIVAIVGIIVGQSQKAPPSDQAPQFSPA